MINRWPVGGLPPARPHERTRVYRSFCRLRSAPSCPICRVHDSDPPSFRWQRGRPQRLGYAGGSARRGRTPRDEQRRGRCAPVRLRPCPPDADHRVEPGRVRQRLRRHPRAVGRRIWSFRAATTTCCSWPASASAIPSTPTASSAAVSPRRRPRSIKARAGCFRRRTACRSWPRPRRPLAPQQARAFAAEHGFPLLVKPRWGTRIARRAYPDR